MLKAFQKRRGSKGFTLVEVIVVLVILAILAAILIPSLTGYIDKANQKRVIAEARSLYIAAQATLSEEYGVGGGVTAGTITDFTTDKGLEIKTLSELTGDFKASITYDESAKVTGLTYSTGDYKVTYSSSGVTAGSGQTAFGSNWLVEKGASKTTTAATA